MTKAAHPGARASRPHPLPWVVAQFPFDGAPVHCAGGNRMGTAQAEPGRLCRSIRVEEMGEALPVLCGRDARAPGWASSHDAGISRSRYRRCIALTPIRVHSCSFVSRWFVFKNDRLHSTREGAGARLVKQRLVAGGGKPVQSQTWVVGLFTWMHRMHRIIGRHRHEFNHRLCSNTDLPKPAPRLLDHYRHPPDHRAGLLPVAQRLVPFILSILCIHVQ